MSGASIWRTDRFTATVRRCARVGVGRVGCAATRRAAARLLEHPRADRHDQAGLLGERDELVRADEPAARGAPSAAAPRRRPSPRSRGRRRAGSGPRTRRARARGAAPTRSPAAGRPWSAAPRRTARCGPGRAPWRGTSRRRSRAAGSPVSASSSAMAMPRLAVTCISWSPMRPRLARARRAPGRRSARSRRRMTSSQTTTNSSPPNRATVSPGRIAAAIRVGRRAAAARRRRRGPSESLTTLKWSTSRNITPSCVPRRREPARPWTSRSVSSARLGRPVSESCSAWCASSCSISLAAGDVLELREEVLRLARLVAHEGDVQQRPHDRLRPAAGSVARPRRCRGRRPAGRRTASPSGTSSGWLYSSTDRPTSSSCGAAEDRAHGRVDARREPVEIGDRGADRRPARSRSRSGSRPSRRTRSASTRSVSSIIVPATLHDRAVGARPRGPPGARTSRSLAVGADDAELEIERLAALDGGLPRLADRRAGRRGGPSRRTGRWSASPSGRGRGSGSTPSDHVSSPVATSNSKLPRWAIRLRLGQPPLARPRARAAPRRRSVMSWAITDSPTTVPASSVVVEAVMSTSTRLPSLRRRTVSSPHVAAAGQQPGADRRLLGRPVVRRDQATGLTDDLLGAVSEQPLGGRVPAGDDAVDGHPEDRVARAVDDGRELPTGRLVASRSVTSTTTTPIPMTSPSGTSGEQLTSHRRRCMPSSSAGPVSSSTSCTGSPVSRTCRNSGSIVGHSSGNSEANERPTWSWTGHPLRVGERLVDPRPRRGHGRPDRGRRAPWTAGSRAAPASRSWRRTPTAPRRRATSRRGRPWPRPIHDRTHPPSSSTGITLRACHRYSPSARRRRPSNDDADDVARACRQARWTAATSSSWTIVVQSPPSSGAVRPV